MVYDFFCRTASPPSTKKPEAFAMSKPVVWLLFAYVSVFIVCEGDAVGSQFTKKNNCKECPGI